MSISATQIAVNKYAPEGSEAINLYSTDTADSLTIGQLSISVCVRAAAAYEAQSVMKMNDMTSGSRKLDEAADWLKQIAEGTANWTQAKDFLTNVMGIPASDLPDNINTYDKRMKAASLLKNKMDPLTQLQQQKMIDLQTLVNRRDVAYSTSSNIVRTLGTSSAGNANNF